MAVNTPDLINGIFECCGAALTALSARAVYRDRGYAGIYPPAIILFTGWGFWNLVYYPHLNQWCSFVGGALLVCANVTWLGLIAYFGKKGQP